MTQALATDRQRQSQRERESKETATYTQLWVTRYAYTLMWYHTGYQVCGPQNGEHANFYFDSDVPVWCLF